MTENRILDKVNYPSDIKELTIEELKQLSQEIREFLIEHISKIGGHLASSLGAVELTLAIHYVYNTPQDKTVWDVGHQGYVHKILTGRKNKIDTIRRLGGISGFLKMEESEYDNFGAGHATTSLSAAAGIAAARDNLGDLNKVIAIIGDGSLTGGMAYEALNNIGNSGSDITLILNDNNMSISPNVGAISRYLDEIITNPVYRKIKNEVWNITEKLPGKHTIRKIIRETQSSIKKAVTPGLLFEALGIQYYGPVDGHNLDELIKMLTRIEQIKGPKLLHVLSKKGKGMPEAEQNPVYFHGISPSSKSAKPVNPNFLDVAGKTLSQLMDKDDKIVGITAAMAEGTGLKHIIEKHPNKLFDVGIAEEHAVLFAAGMATLGIKPFVAIYSTFLQRSFDMLVHDVALQKLPVVFLLDRAGLVGADGPTHHGTLDLGYLNIIPNMVIAAPKNGVELQNLMYSALKLKNKPMAIRYPKERTVDEVSFNGKFEELEIGSWEILQKGKKVAIIATGSMVPRAHKVCNSLQNNGINPTLVNARFIKPLDEKLLSQILKEHSHVFVLEENTIVNGLGTNILYFQNRHNIKAKINLIGLPDSFIEHGTREELLDIVGLSPSKIEKRILDYLK